MIPEVAAALWESVDELAGSIAPDPPVAVAVVASIALVAWGNFVVVRSETIRGRYGLGPSERFTLVAHGVAATLTVAAALLAGFTPSDLGLSAPRLEGSNPWLVAVVALTVVWTLRWIVAGVFRHRSDPSASRGIRLVRLLVGTAGGEEVLFRGFLLAVWAGSGAAPTTVVVANAVVFGLWHYAGAPEGKLRWAHVLVPGIGALAFTGARFLVDSVAGAWLLHVAMNLRGVAMDDRR